MTIENNDLDQKYNQLFIDMQIAQEYRKKMEKNHNEAMNLLEKKVKSLNDYVEELEMSNNTKVKESLSPEVLIYVSLCLNIYIREGKKYPLQRDLCLLLPLRRTLHV